MSAKMLLAKAKATAGDAVLSDAGQCRTVSLALHDSATGNVASELAAAASVASASQPQSASVILLKESRLGLLSRFLRDSLARQHLDLGFGSICDLIRHLFSLGTSSSTASLPIASARSASLSLLCATSSVSSLRSAAKREPSTTDTGGGTCMPSPD